MMSLFDVLVLDAFGAVWLCWVLFSWKVRGTETTRVVTLRETRREDTAGADPTWAEQLESWNRRKPVVGKHEGTIDMMPLILSGEVLEGEEDELGRWFRQQHEPCAPAFFEELQARWETPFDHTWEPWFSTPTRYWSTIVPSTRQLEAASQS